MAYIFRFLIALAVCLQSTAFADEAPQTLDELKVAIEKIRVESDLPGLGIALVDKNGPYWVAGLGQANLQSKMPATENTLFRIGSTSKMFVGLSVLKLVEEGKLNLNDKLSDLAPEIYFENPWEKTNPILLVNLLEHTTGWDDIGFPVYGRQDANISLKEALDFHPQYRKSRWIPGTRYSYNNAGPAVAAYIVQKIVGQSYEDYVQANFFSPLQMNATSFFQTNLYEQQGASLYSADAKPQPYWHLILRPSGSINSSATDMAKYLQFLIARGEYNQQHLISESSFTRMETSTSTLGAQAGTRAGYGLTNYVQGHEMAGYAFRGHDGDVSGGHCRLSYIPELNSGFVLMVNQDNMQALEKIPALIRAYLIKDSKKAEPKPIALPKKFQQLSGYYFPINSRSEMSRFNTEVLGVWRYTVSDNHVYREPLLAGWEHPSNDYAINEDALINPWTGLATIAIVQDPLAGEAVEVSDDIRGSLFQKVSPVRVFGILGWIGLTIILSITSIIFALVWGVRLACRKISKGASITIRVWPLVTSLVMALGLFAPSILQPGLETMGEVSLTNLIIFFCSTALPLSAAYSLLNVYRYRKVHMNPIVYWHSTVLSLLHCGLAICLAYYGLFAIRMWA